MKNILIKGSGVGGLTAAYELSKRGHKLTLSAPLDTPDSAASWYAGGMLAPYCERESAEQIVEDLGLNAMQWWSENFPDLVHHKGTLVVAPTRDLTEIKRFSARTKAHEEVNATEISVLEPDLSGRFQKGLFYPTEAHIDPRHALAALRHYLVEYGTTFVDIGQDESQYDLVIDATGIARLNHDPDLRGVRGEMILLRCRDVHFSRPIRLLHPRIPLYIVPREDNIFMVGATMIESDFAGAISARSMMEFLNATYALHPAFAEAEIIEIGVGIRPAYPDNFPRVTRDHNRIFINGFFRHGYLLSPEMAMQAARLVDGLNW